MPIPDYQTLMLPLLRFSVSASYIVKRIDSDYFEEGEVGL